MQPAWHNRTWQPAKLVITPESRRQVLSSMPWRQPAACPRWASEYHHCLKLAHSALAACRPSHTSTADAAQACWVSFDAPRPPLQGCYYEARHEWRYAEISAKNRTRPDVGATAIREQSRPSGRYGRQRGWWVCQSVDGGCGRPSLCGQAGPGRQPGGRLCMAGGRHDECRPTHPSTTATWAARQI